MTKHLLAVWMVIALVSTALAGEARRAGCPQCVHRFAQPSNTPKYSGGYVGGGAILPGEGRLPSEGTWGWDYSGLISKRIWLGWSHRHYETGGGKYDTDR
jgi:hypothetical protein